MIIDSKNADEILNAERKSRRELCTFGKERSFDPNRSKGNVSEERPMLATTLWAIVSTIVAQTVLQAEVASSYLPLLVIQCHNASC